MEGGVEDVGLLQAVQLHLAVAHLVVHTLQLVVQLQLLPLELTVLFLVPEVHTRERTHTQKLNTMLINNTICFLMSSLRYFKV